MHASRCCSLITVLLLLVPRPAWTQSSFEVVRTFVAPPQDPFGRLVEMPDGSLYGVTLRGGVRNMGAIVRYDRLPDATLDATTVHQFTGGDGEGPFDGLVRGLDGSLYGTTVFGGAHNRGTAFKYTPGGSLTVLHVFSEAADDVPNRGPLTVGADGNFYGIGSGRFFRLTPAGQITVLTPGHIALSGPEHVPLIAAPDGNLYGVSAAFFRITLAGALTVLSSTFDPFAGETPTTLARGGDGNFYLTTQGSFQPNILPVLFRMTPAGVRTRVLTFPSDVHVQDLIPATDGRLYGATDEALFGRLFSVTTNGQLTTLHWFSYWDGRSPHSLVQTSDGNILGLAGGGPSRRGVVFRLSAAGVAVVQAFDDPTPLMPAGGLIRGGDGALYGTSCLGGNFNAGSVYRLSLANEVTVLHSFAYWDGVCPLAGLTLGPGGVLYGTTYGGSLFGRGSIFKITTGGVFTPLHFFAAGTGRARTSPVLASDGHLYGTYLATNQRLGGGIYRIAPTDTVTILHQFGTANGELRGPGDLAEGPDAALYGFLARGGPGDQSTAFRMPLGPAPRIVPFSPVGWDFPVGGSLTPTGDGDFYTIATSPAGTHLARMTTDGVVTVFDAVLPGSSAVNQLMVGSDGNIYGTATPGNFVQPGTVFRMTPAGELTVLHTFPAADGQMPALYAALLEASPGVLYGTTFNRDPVLPTMIYRLTVSESEDREPPSATASPAALRDRAPRCCGSR